MKNLIGLFFFNLIALSASASISQFKGDFRSQSCTNIKVHEAQKSGDDLYIEFTRSGKTIIISKRNGEIQYQSGGTRGSLTGNISGIFSLFGGPKLKYSEKKGFKLKIDGLKLEMKLIGDKLEIESKENGKKEECELSRFVEPTPEIVPEVETFTVTETHTETKKTVESSEREICNEKPEPESLGNEHSNVMEEMVDVVRDQAACQGDVESFKEYIDDRLNNLIISRDKSIEVYEELDKEMAELKSIASTSCQINPETEETLIRACDMWKTEFDRNLERLANANLQSLKELYYRDSIRSRTLLDACVVEKYSRIKN